VSDGIQQITILGTGLIGTSVGLALKKAGFAGKIVGWDTRVEETHIAFECGALTEVTNDPDNAAYESDVVLLATPVLGVLDWMERLAPYLTVGQLVTDVGSTKREISDSGLRLYPQEPSDAPHQSARFLPGHPMAGKESGGAALAEATLFQNAMWLFTPAPGAKPSALETEWRAWVAKFGARTMDLDPTRHDEICAWVSHLPQMLSTSLAALLEETFGSDPRSREEIAAIGGRALRETTRLGASPYSMWRDIALSNTEPIAQTLHALEQRLAHVRENLRTPELKEEFRLANEFRGRRH
jgi:prephenate dehydrogenase